MKRVIVRPAVLTTLLVVSTALSACSRPHGDFGRIEPNFLHETVLPKTGALIAKRRGEQVSNFRKTDEERKLEDLSWNIVRPLHVDDWVSGTLVEGRRTRVFPEIADRLDHRAYLFYLRAEPFRSSETRWDRLISDIRTDQGFVAPFYDQARIVFINDRQRVAFLEKNAEAFDLPYRQSAKARIAENEKLIDVALQSFRFRFQAYDHAIRRLTVETPSPRAQVAFDELQKYGKIIETGGDRGLPFFDEPELLSSRIVAEGPLPGDLKDPGEKPPLQK
ncbi:MAG: hypothetical protein AAGE61_19555 [Pseudomonadota bacterium]